MNVRLLLNAVLLCALSVSSQYRVDVVPDLLGIASMQMIGDSLYLNCSHIEGQGALVVVKNGAPRVVHTGNDYIGHHIKFTVFNNAVYYCFSDSTYNNPGPSMNALWKTDGISVVTKVVPESIGEPVIIDGFMYFRKHDSLSGYELWKSDGKNANMVADMVPGTGDFFPAQITVFNKKLYFMANQPQYGFELWTSDGTEAGTHLVKDIWPGTDGSGNVYTSESGFMEYNNRFYFVVNDGIHGMELWYSDGTSAGTNLLKDIHPGEASAFKNSNPFTPPIFCVFNNELYFVPETSTNGKELWKTDGTTSGTVMVKDINPGPDGSDITELQVNNGYLYFNANDGVHGKELWRTDGTPEGTVMVLDLQPQIPGEISSNPKELFNHIDGKLYFVCKKSLEVSFCDKAENCPLHVTVSLYRTDGTIGGTEKIYDFPAGEDLDSNHMITSANSGLYFRSVSGNRNWLLWLRPDTHSDFSNTLSAPVNESVTVQAMSPASYGILEVYSYDEQINNYCQSNPRIRVVNTGITPVSDFKVEYYFTVEGGKTPILEKYYTGDCSVSLVSLGGSNYKIVYDYTGKTIQPGQSLPDLAGSVVGLHYSDYSLFDITNDYSNNFSSTFSVNNHICIYSKSDSLIYGIPYGSYGSNHPPVAIARSSDAITDYEGDGERVLLDGSLSYDSDGAIISYEWYDGSTLIAKGKTGYVILLEGKHTIILKVTDEDGATAFDTITVNVVYYADKVTFYIRTYLVPEFTPVVIQYYVPIKYDGAVIRYVIKRNWGGPISGTLDGSMGSHVVKYWEWTKGYFGESGPWAIVFEVNGVITDTLYIKFAY